MIEEQDDNILKAVTGLEGGCVAGGSTCGVVTGGALGIAMMHERTLKAGNINDKKHVMKLAAEYVQWFNDTYGSSLCRERTGTDFYSTWGQLWYSLTLRRLSGCFWHIRGAMRQLNEMKNHVDCKAGKHNSKKIKNPPFHCAKSVLEGIHRKTGIGNKRLENLSFIFDGGVGFTGGVCGALVGAITGINLMLGMRVRDMSYWDTIKGFAVGHVNLLIDKSLGKPEPFMAGKQVVRRFTKKAGSLECDSITGKSFTGWDDFQAHITADKSCKDLIGFVSDEASEVIWQYKK